MYIYIYIIFDEYTSPVNQHPPIQMGNFMSVVPVYDTPSSDTLKCQFIGYIFSIFKLL